MALNKDCLHFNKDGIPAGRILDTLPRMAHRAITFANSGLPLIVWGVIMWGVACAVAAPAPPTASLGAFITPVAATASSAQDAAGRTATRLIDGSGWGETLPGSGVYTHTANVYEGGANMWNGAADAVLEFDLGKVYRVNGCYIWNYNEANGWNSRSVKELEILASEDGRAFGSLGQFTLAEAPGRDDYAGEAVPFKSAVRARYFRFQIKSNYKGGENSGLSEVRFSNADAKALVTAPLPWRPKYARPRHPAPGVGRPLPGNENIVYPPDAGIVDVTQAPYGARGDGLTDDTGALQRALDDHPNQGAIIYLPNGVYRVSNTLRWPHGKGNGDEEKNTVLQGQSRAGTVIQLRDNCPGFQNPRQPQSPLWTGRKPAQRFGNEIHNLTVDTGSGNPGACGIQFIANNQGGVYDVSIVSGDGQGVAGLDLGYTDEQGPCLIKNVSVLGFDIGIHTATSVASETLEHIVLQQQNKFGLRNDGQPCTVRDLRSLNEVPAFVAGGGFSVLIGATCTGTGAAATQPAIIAEAALVARDIHTAGYRVALANRTGDRQELAGPNLDQFLTKPAASLFGAPAPPLRLPIRETPEVPWDAPAGWTAPQKFGAVTGDGRDDSAAIQQAIDSGATTVYLPRGTYTMGHTVIIRGNVRRLVGCKAWLEIADPLRGQVQPVFRFENGRPPVVVMEGIATDFSGGPYCFLENVASRTLVMRRLMINFQRADAYHGIGPGTVFIEDVVGRWFRFKDQTVWARQFNPEGDGTHIANDGGTLWILGLKTEGGGTLVETKNGGKTEVLGSFSYTVGPGRLAPMFVIDNAQVSISFAEVNYTGDPFATIVRETRGAITREMKNTDPAWHGHFTLFTAGAP